MSTGTLRIDGAPPYDGEYDIPTSYTNRELHKIKQISGTRAGELAEALTAGDVGTMVAIAAIILERQGKWPVVNLEPLWNVVGGFEVIEHDDEPEDEDRPPAIATAGGNGSAPDEPTFDDESESSSGSLGDPDGVSSQLIPSRTGLPGSETSAGFDPPISES